MKLIILNGPVGVGKTTVAKELQKKLPLSFFVHFDELRRHIGGYREYRHESRVLTFDIVYAIIHECFKQGKDVLIDKIMYNHLEEGKTKTSLNLLKEVADQYGSTIYEFILWADKETVLKRLETRGYSEGGLLTPEKAEGFWEKMNKFKDERKEAQIVDTTTMSPDEVFEEVWKKLSQS